MLIIILSLLLVLSIVLLASFIIRRDRDIQKIIGIIDTLKTGGETGSVRTSLSFIELRDALVKDFSSISRMMDRQSGSIQRNEKAGMRLSKNIEKAVISASQISTHTEANRQSSNSLFDSVTEGSAAVEEINASLASFRKLNDRQNQSIVETARAIGFINSSIQDVSSIASGRLESVNHLIKVTSEGSEKVHENSDVIRNIQKQVDDVLSLITVINDIASQTNLLSMNAAIEAAHAGEAGKGFAVVAEEIRSLAESTAQNALTISGTLNTLVEQINRAGTISRESGESFDEIEKGAGAVAEAFSEIHDKTDSLLASSEQLSHSTRELQEISAESTASIHEIEFGSSDINKVLQDSKQIASNLRDAMQHLTDESRISNYNLTKVSESYLNSSDSFLEIIQSRTEFVKDLNVSENKLIISNLMVAHVGWMGMARSVLDGSVSESESNILDENSCRLGHWIHTEGKEYIKNSKNYDALNSRHSRLHQVIGEIVKLKKSGNLMEAEKQFALLTDISAEIVQILMTLGYSDFVSWNSSLSVKVKEFDNQHKKLLQLITDLYNRMQEGAGNNILGETLKKLIDYTVYHFGTEEKNFHKFNYPHKKEHIEQHETLVSKAKELYKSFENSESVLSIEVLDFLQEWVIQHINKADKQYSEFFAGKEISA